MGEFTGIWVSKELINLGLNPSKTMVLSMIKELQPFHASNKYIGEKLNLTGRSVTTIITDLQGKKLINITGKTSARVITIEDTAIASYRRNFHSTIEETSHTQEETSLTKEETSTNIIHNKYNKDDNKELAIKPKTQIAKKKKKVHPLYSPIKESFLSKNGNVFTNYAKEGMGIKGLIKKAEIRGEGNPEIFIQNMIEQFYKMSSNGDKFWNQQPFLPSVLNADGIFDRVLKQLIKSQPKEITEDDYEILKEVSFGS